MTSYEGLRFGLKNELVVALVLLPQFDGLVYDEIGRFLLVFDLQLYQGERLGEDTS